MSKVICPGCGKKFISEEHFKAHADREHPLLIKDGDGPVKSKGWATPYGFVDFAEPVTYEEAVEVSAMFRKMFEARRAGKPIPPPT